MKIDQFLRAVGRARIAVMSAAGMALLATVVGVAAPTAGAAPQTKYYDAAANPTNVYVATPSSVTVTLTNDQTSTQSFGSAELSFGSLPASAIDTANISVSPSWSQNVVSQNPLTMVFTSGTQAAIAPQSALSITFQLTAPSAATVDVTTEVKQSNDFSGHGNDFVDLTPNPLQITVTPATLAFAQQPPSAVQQGSASNPNYMCPAVAVSVTAGPGGPGIANASVTLNYAGPANPGLYYDGHNVTSSGVTLQTGPDGTATFGSCSGTPSGLGASNLGSGYELSADSPAAAGPIASNPFSVVQAQEQCTGNCPPVTVTSPSTNTSGTISTTGTGTYDLVGSFGQGELQCDSLVTTSAGDPLMVQTTPVTTGATDYAVVSMTFPKKVVNSLVNNGTPLMQVCAGATQPFTGSNSADQPIPNATYPYQGLLPDCTTGYLGDPGQFCVVSRNKNAGASETIQIYVGADYSSDPSFW